MQLNGIETAVDYHTLNSIHLMAFIMAVYATFSLLSNDRTFHGAFSNCVISTIPLFA